MRALIELGADVNKRRDNGVTPLSIAALEGHEAVVRALLELGADLNETEDNGGRPLYMAAQNGHEAVVRMLIEAGGRTSTRYRILVRRRCSSPLITATRRWLGC